MKRAWETIRTHFVHRILSVPVRVKIMGVVLGVIFLLAAATMLQVRATFEDRLRDELKRRGVFLSEYIATEIADLVLADNVRGVEKAIRRWVEEDEDVCYVVVLDAQNRVIAQTFEQGFPQRLLAMESTDRPPQPGLHLLSTRAGAVWDATKPIPGGRAGTVRVGMSERRLRQTVAGTTRLLLSVTAAVSVLGVAGALLLTFVVAGPIHELVRAADAVSRGDYQRKALVWADDELGRLAMAFNRMTEALVRSRQEIEESNRQLLRRNAELSVLNIVSQTVSSSLELSEVLNRSLEKVLELLEADAGWVFLCEPKTENLVLSASRGLPESMEKGRLVEELGQCLCREVQEAGEARVLRHFEERTGAGCALMQATGLSVHASIPLKSRDTVLGIMNVACRENRVFTPEDLRLLTMIGHQIGVAIENASLYQEVRQREQARRRRLDEVIQAQEEERKRVARELHDQVGQSLTALLMELAAIKTLVPVELEHVRDLLTRCHQLAAEMLEELRRLMMNLRPALLDDLGLIAAIKSYAEHQLPPAGVEPTVEVHGPRRRLPSPIDIAVYRIVQEGITNIVKHAGAKRATIRIVYNTDRVALTIEDDGKGFDTSKPHHSHGALGLLGMQERVTLLGGSFRVESRPGNGTRVLVEVPVPRKEESSDGQNSHSAGG